MNSTQGTVWASQCNDVTVLGGMSNIGTKATKSFELDGLYNYLILTGNLYFFDSWDGEYFRIYVDGDEVYSVRSYHTLHNDLCASLSWGDRV